MRTVGAVVRRLLGHLVLALFAVVFTLGVCEIAMRLMGYEAIYTVYSSPEIFWRKDELLGWSHQANTEGTYVGPRPWPIEYESPVRINALGLRGPEIEELPAGGYRVMVLGDSVVAGFEVDWQHTFTALIQERLTKEFGFPVQVINAGVRGYGTDQSYLYFAKRGRHLAPNLVVLLYGGNDFADIVTLHRMRRMFGKGALAPTSTGELEMVGYPIPDYPLCSEWVVDTKFKPLRVDTSFESAMCSVQTQLSDRSALFTFLSLRIRQSPKLLRFLYDLGSPSGGAEAILLGLLGENGPELPNVAPRFDLNTLILRALAREVDRIGGELVLPVKQGKEALAPDLAFDRVYNFVLDDLLAQPEYHYINDSHFNEKGHAALAERLGNLIAERIRARHG